MTNGCRRPRRMPGLCAHAAMHEAGNQSATSGHPKPPRARAPVARRVGRPWIAGALTAVACLVRPAEPLVMTAVEAWASSRALGQSSMRLFLSRAIPQGRHAAFVRWGRARRGPGAPHCLGSAKHCIGQPLARSFSRWVAVEGMSFQGAGERCRCAPACLRPTRRIQPGRAPGPPAHTRARRTFEATIITCEWLGPGRCGAVRTLGAGEAAARRMAAWPMPGQQQDRVVCPPTAALNWRQAALRAARPDRAPGQ